MKKETLLTIFFAYLCTITLAQDTTYYGKNGIILKDKSSALVYRILTRDKADTNKVNVKYFFPNDTNKQENNYSNFTKGTLHGPSMRWYKTGELKEIVKYDQGKIIGSRVTYWQNGITRRKDKYEDGKLKKGKVWDSHGKKQHYYGYYQDAKFNSKDNGGLSYYIMDNVQYPQKAIEKNIQGKVKVRFVVDLDGSITDAEVVEGVSEELDKEAIRLIEAMPKWIPAKWDGEPNRQRMLIPINFEL